MPRRRTKKPDPFVERMTRIADGDEGPSGGRATRGMIDQAEDQKHDKSIDFEAVIRSHDHWWVLTETQRRADEWSALAGVTGISRQELQHLHRQTGGKPAGRRMLMAITKAKKGLGGRIGDARR